MATCGQHKGASSTGSGGGGGDWHLVRLLGEGAFGQVRLIASPAGDLLAMKCVGVAQSPDAMQTAKKEVQFLRALQSCRNVVKLMSCRQTDDFVYIFLEFADGGELFDQIEPDEGMASVKAQHYMRQLLAGLGFMHRRGVAHRDIKPENLLLVRNGVSDDNDRLVISDFGFATVFLHKGQRRTTTTRCGTLPYVAPEVLSSKPYDADRSDVWSCGVVLVAMLTGLLPWDQADDACDDYKRWLRRTHCDYTSVAPWKCIGTAALALLHELLATDAEQRCTVDRAVKHPWITGNLLEQPAKLSRSNSNELRTPLAGVQRNLKRKLDVEIPDACQSQPVSPCNATTGLDLSLGSLEELRVSTDGAQAASGGGGRNAFSQPADIDSSLIGTQTQPVTTQTQSADWLVRTYRRMTRFVVTLERRRAMELLATHFRRCGCDVSATGSDGVLQAATVDRRRQALQLRATCFDMQRGRLLVECERTRGDGLEFKRMFVRLREQMRPHICTDTTDWVQKQSQVPKVAA